MKPIAHKRFSLILNNNLYWSKAYQSLTISARNLMWCMVAELRFTGSRKKRTFAYTNNGKISFTEYEFKAQGLGASETYIRARNQLIRVGFIEMTYQGGRGSGDCNKYKLLFIEGVRQLDKKWENYPKQDWEDDIPKVKDYAIGRGTRFKKKNNTLKNNTPKDTNLPTKLVPSLKISLDD